MNLHLNKIGIVVGRFNSEITDRLLQGALDELKLAGIDIKQITVVKVPGAVEIPLTAKFLAKTKQYAGIICLGAVIQGDTDHHIYVNEQVSLGCQQVMLECDLPVIFGILTTHNEEQAWQRVGGSHGHKGRDAAATALEMIEILRAIENGTINS